ncbi:hypothetical protein, partial [Prolixibacter bellariivorans]|uniref:hypothetical protein n=1 Tax=Prolixibacter bellariivorans TaxID=314319 RepID=UPI00056618F5
GWPVKVGRASVDGIGFVRVFRDVRPKKQNHDAGERITLTCPDVHRGWVLLCQDKSTGKKATTTNVKRRLTREIELSPTFVGQALPPRNYAIGVVPE